MLASPPQTAKIFWFTFIGGGRKYFCWGQKKGMGAKNNYEWGHHID